MITATKTTRITSHGGQEAPAILKPNTQAKYILPDMKKQTSTQGEKKAELEVRMLASANQIHASRVTKQPTFFSGVPNLVLIRSNHLTLPSRKEEAAHSRHS